MKTQLLCTLLLLIWLVRSDGTITETHVDLVGSCLAQGSALLKRVQKKVDVRFIYTLNPLDKWSQFADMAIQFQVPFDQFVFIKYNIVAYTIPQTHLVTRLMIDSQENRDFRVTTSILYTHTHNIDEQVWITKGKHFAKVQYRTPSGTTNHYEDFDYLTAVFIVRYFHM